MCLRAIFRPSAEILPAGPGQRGAALLLALLMTLVLAAIGAGLIAVTVTDTLISGAHRTGYETMYAAEAALERAIHDLAPLADWSPVLVPAPGNLVSTFIDGQAAPGAPDGSQLDIAALTAERQRTSDARETFVQATDLPRWQLYAQGPLGTLPAAAPGPPAYLLVWVADDAEGDGDPTHDSNGQILVYAEAHGTGGARRALEATVRRARPGVVEVLTRRAVR